MKIHPTLVALSIFLSCTARQSTVFTGSTPAGPGVRSFLGIPQGDSIDFIRWNLTVENNLYILGCNYGIGKPNTNGFIDGGKRAEWKGECIKDDKYYKLKNIDRILILARLNSNLLHILDNSGNFLAGNGGWSYTLNNKDPSPGDQLNFNGEIGTFKDSIQFQGRTPCAVPGIIPQGMECYKLKWLMTLFASKENYNSGTYRLLGTAYRKQGGMTGTWKLVKRKNEQVVYELLDEQGNELLYLEKLSDQILLFADSTGNLLTGNEDFSYTLSRVEKSKD